MQKTGNGYLRPILTVFFPLCGGFFLTSIFRTVNAVQAPAITASLHLTTIDLGLLTAAYFIAYGLFQIPLGLLLDRFGARKVQTTLLIIACFAVLLFAIATNVTELVLSRLLVGIGVSAGLTAGFKANSEYFPKRRLALVNSLMMAIGGLGAIVATYPTEWMISKIGWRYTNLWFAATVFTIAIIIFILVPESKNKIVFDVKVVKSISAEMLVILKNRFFWSIAPLMAATSGFFVAFQGLWAGSWLRNVANLSGSASSIYLLIFAIAVSVGMLLVALITNNAEKLKISLLKITISGFLLTFLLEIILLTNALPQSVILWFLFGAIAQMLTLFFTIASHYFPSSQTGRATTGLVLVLFITACLMQFGIGVIIHLWGRLPSGNYPIIAYQTSCGICVGLQLLAFLWFIRSTKYGAEKIS